MSLPKPYNYYTGRPVMQTRKHNGEYYTASFDPNFTNIFGMKTNYRGEQIDSSGILFAKKNWLKLPMAELIDER